MKYRITGSRDFLDPDGYPAIKPPWGTLNAIDLNTGKYLWKIPLGEYPDLAAKGLTNTGTENYGGPIVTAGNVLFIGATVYDKKFRAFDSLTGQLLWETVLPFAAVATPATYMIDGKQYVVVMPGAGKTLRLFRERVCRVRFAIGAHRCRTWVPHLFALFAKRWEMGLSQNFSFRFETQTKSKI